jgi:hypothetical protein
MAGSTDFKLSDQMAAICREGKRRGLWIHAGRVNTGSTPVTGSGTCSV